MAARVERGLWNVLLCISQHLAAGLSRIPHSPSVSLGEDGGRALVILLPKTLPRGKS